MDFNVNETINTVNKYIRMGTNSELNDLMALIKLRKDNLAKGRMTMLKVGDKVSFAHNGRMLTGTIRRKNIKKVVIDTKEGGWTVPVNVLEDTW